MYIECKAKSCTGPARIGLVTFSKTGRTLYYKGQEFQSIKVPGPESNYTDQATGEEYWISSCKKDERSGESKHYGEQVPVEIDDDVREEYWKDIKGQPERINDMTI